MFALSNIFLRYLSCPFELICSIFIQKFLIDPCNVPGTMTSVVGFSMVKISMAPLLIKLLRIE